MKAIATDGTIFTYDAEINGWLMPEIVKIEEKGVIPYYYPNIDLDGRILSTMWTIALYEPTPYGEMVVGTVVISLYAYTAYQVFATIWNETLFQTCLDKFIYCWAPNCIDCCSACLEACRKGYGWDERKCPIN